METRLSLENRITQWVQQWGLRRNPFDRGNADLEQDLPRYFVEVDQFADLQARDEPCLALGGRGCGKTAQRRMLASSCRPAVAGSDTLAVEYTYRGFEVALQSVHDDLTRLQVGHHIRAILHCAVAALHQEGQVRPHTRLALQVAGKEDLFAAYVRTFAPHLADGAVHDETHNIAQLNPLTQLSEFITLLDSIGVQRLMILMDRLDEFALTADQPANIVAFLKPLLSTLELLEMPGLALKCFAPHEVGPLLRKEKWFRADRIHQSRIVWTPAALQELITQRLASFSQSDPPTLERLSQLCVDQFEVNLDEELTLLAEGYPRAALALADRLIRTHCAAAKPARLISPATWKQVKAEWPDWRASVLGLPGGQEPDQAPSIPKPVAVLSPQGYPVLVVDAANRHVWVGLEDLASDVTPQDFLVLASLYRHRTQIVTKETLVTEAWPGAQGGVSDETIAQSIARLRRALRGDKADRGYIETIKRMGYRLHPDGFSTA